MRTAAALLSATVLGLTGLTSCGDGTAAGDGQVVAAFYPLAYAAERVAGDHLEVVNLTSPGAEPHDLELTIQQTATVARASLVIHSSGLQPAVDTAVEENAGGAVLDAAAVVDLMPAADHSDHEAEGGDGHDHGDADPHFWLDPLRMADLGDAIAQQLADLDPDNAADYEANAGALRDDLEALDREYADGLASCQRDLVVVTHDAFGYLGKYDLHFEPILGLSPDAEPSAATLSQLRQLIRDEGLTTVFSETLASPRTAQALARDAGVSTAVLDPIEGLPDDGSDADYVSLMRANLQVLDKANGC